VQHDQQLVSSVTDAIVNGEELRQAERGAAQQVDVRHNAQVRQRRRDARLEIRHEVVDLVGLRRQPIQRFDGTHHLIFKECQ
jgi:hypothetical protein